MFIHLCSVCHSDFSGRKTAAAKSQTADWLGFYHWAGIATGEEGVPPLYSIMVLETLPCIPKIFWATFRSLIRLQISSDTAVPGPAVFTWIPSLTLLNQKAVACEVMHVKVANSNLALDCFLNVGKSTVLLWQTQILHKIILQNSTRCIQKIPDVLHAWYFHKHIHGHMEEQQI